MLKKILNILSWLLIFSYLFITLGFVSEKQNQVSCDSLNIRIIDTTGNNFVNYNDIKNMFSDRKVNLLGKAINKINLAQLESIIYQNSSVKNVEVYKDFGILTIEIEQRNPILRIINRYNHSFYIDYDGGLMPFSNKYTARVLVANGYINNLYYKCNTKDLLKINNEEDSLKSVNLLNKLFTIAKYIYNDKFLNAQIEQIYINENNEIEMIPKIGSHLIIFGDIYNVVEKFRNLKAFYHHKINSVGWNKYSIINLKYKNQVVCTKNLYYDTKK